MERTSPPASASRPASCTTIRSPGFSSAGRMLLFRSPIEASLAGPRGGRDGALSRVLGCGPRRISLLDRDLVQALMERGGLTFPLEIPMQSDGKSEGGFE